jgi:hypothetical protein
MDLNTIGAAFVVVVVGGMGSLPGAYVAALLIAEIKALCIWLGVVQIFGVDVSFSKLTLMVDFLVMAIVLVCAAWGLFGRPQAPSRYVGMQEEPLRPPSNAYLIAAAVLGADARGAAAAHGEFALHDGADDRPADRRAVRHQPALHHGPGGHAFLRPRRVLRARCLRRGAAGALAAPADGSSR